MKFKFYYYKSFEKSIHEKIDSMCSSINETQNEDIISCYISDISVFEIYIYWVFDPDNEEGKAEISRKGMLKLMKRWIEFRKKKIPENYEEYEEIIEVD